jgi:hypothetical protein
VQKIVTSQGEGRALSFNHYNEHLLATTGEAPVVAVWDLRNTEGGKAPLAQLEGHTQEVARPPPSAPPFAPPMLGEGVCCPMAAPAML